MNNKILIKSLLFLMLFGVSIQSQDFTKAGSTAAQFLKIPVGARAVAMGNTFSSVSNDASAMYWNSAGLPQIKNFVLNFTHSQWIADMDHNYFGMVLPLDGVSAVGLSVIQFAAGQMENTTIRQPQGTGTFFDAEDLAISVSYARQVIEQVSVGFTAKYISQRIWNTSAETFAFDFCVLLKTGYKNLQMGFSFQNFGPELTMRGSDLVTVVDLDENSTINPGVESNFATQPFSLPTSYRASISMGLIGNDGLIQFENSTLLVAADAVHLNDNPEHYSLGAEYGFMEMFFIRGGYNFNTDEEGLTLGTGLSFDFGSSKITFDYAYATFGVFDAVNIFSVHLSP
ncbi:MAG: PorV/PorQ family protein [Melioribacteraceae bacterium]|nr:PorV/PorQ family protein [Melioribacteraceae bacterium]MCF8262853.1 PorV/PorQ family protein [Melioribacteraceae bacterium]MCF8430644.1 PorV/PorQ family protein [Melioribacteraceae bacterium]